MKKQAFALLALISASSAHAASFTVDTGADAVDINPGDGLCATANAGTCSLRAAIQEANALSGADEIILPDGLYTLNIPGKLEDLGATGDLDIYSDLRIIGNVATPANVVVDGGGQLGLLQDRLFHIRVPDSGQMIEVNIEGVTIQNGYATDVRAGGGAMCIQCVGMDGLPFVPASLGSVIPEIDPGSFGGTPNNYFEYTRPEVTLQHVVIQNNFDYVAGGAICNYGILTIEDSIIRGNRTPYFRGLSVSGQTGAFANNSQYAGGGMGGGLSNWGGKLTVRRSILSDNWSQSGGALFSQDTFFQSEVRIEHSQITANQAFMGAGIYNASGQWDFPAHKQIDYGLTVVSSTLDNNLAELAGGGLYNFALATTLIKNSTISANEVSETTIYPNFKNKGGGIYHSGKILDVVSSTIAGNRTLGNRSSQFLADTSVGGREIFIDHLNAAVNPAGTLPFRLSLQNTLIGDDPLANDNCNGPQGYLEYVSDAGNNIDESGTCFSTQPVTTVINPSFKSLTVASPVNLQALANNGGIPANALPDGTFPPTRALVVGSGAVDISSDCAALDQRGFERNDGSCDVGAFEVNAALVASTTANRPPVANDDYFLVPAGRASSLPLPMLLRNDTDPDGSGIVRVDDFSLPSTSDQGGKISIGTVGSSSIQKLFYTPPAGFVGADSFNYRVDDGSDLSSTATVHFDVQTTSIPLQSYSASFTVLAGERLTSMQDGVEVEGFQLPILDINGNPMDVEILVAPERASNSKLTTSGYFTYSARLTESGPDSMVYLLTDENGFTQKGIVRIFVSPIVKESLNLNVEAGKFVKGKLVSDEAEPAGVINYGIDTNDYPDVGDLRYIDQDTGEFYYQAPTEAPATDAFNIIAYSTLSTFLEVAGETLISVNITEAAANTMPSAIDSSQTMPRSKVTPIQLPATDADGDQLYYRITKMPDNIGYWGLHPFNGVVQLFTSKFLGTDTLEYVVTDGVDESTVGTLMITVMDGVNETPVANDDTAMTSGSGSISINVLANDSDPDGDSLQVILPSTNTPAGGSVSVTDNIVTYTAPDAYEGTDSFSYIVDDGRGGSATAQVTVEVSAVVFNNPTEPPSENRVPKEPDNTTFPQDTSADNSSSGGGSAVNFVTLLFLFMLGLMFRSRRV